MAVTAAAVLYFFQAVSAGQFLDGQYPFLRLHQLATTAADVCVTLALLLAVLLVRPGRGRLTPLVATALLFALAQAQAATGAARVIYVHVPLGFAVILMSWVLAAAAWAVPATRLGRLRAQDRRAPSGSEGAGDLIGPDASSERVRTRDEGSPAR